MDPDPRAVRVLKRLISQVATGTDVKVRITWPSELDALPHGGLPPSGRAQQLLLRLSSATSKWIVRMQAAGQAVFIVLVGVPSWLLMVMAEAAVAVKQLPSRRSSRPPAAVPCFTVKAWPDDEQEPEACWSLLRALERGVLQGVGIELCRGPCAQLHPTRLRREQLALKILKVTGAQMDEEGDDSDFEELNHTITCFGAASIATYIRSMLGTGDAEQPRQLWLVVRRAAEAALCPAGVTMQSEDHLASNSGSLTLTYVIVDRQSVDDLDPFLQMAAFDLHVSVKELSDHTRQLCQHLQQMTLGRRISLNMQFSKQRTTPATGSQRTGVQPGNRAADAVINTGWKVEVLKLRIGTERENQAAVSCIAALESNTSVTRVVLYTVAKKTGTPAPGRQQESARSSRSEWQLVHEALEVTLRRNTTIKAISLKDGDLFEGVDLAVSSGCMASLARNRLLPKQLKGLHDLTSRTHYGRAVAAGFAGPSLLMFHILQWLCHDETRESLRHLCNKYVEEDLTLLHDMAALD
mmetsp:Transcript_44185/g.104604  ORF Transcript_44185/g.104604 Transcript_44185/m.104604 type:complete len:523 (-) Transcript_44185:49-1617(-)